MKEIENQIKQTEERGRRVVEYLDMYKGQNIYNEIALAIEFGYQLRLEEDEANDYTKEDMLEAFNAGNKRGHSGYPNTDNWTQSTFEDFISRKNLEK